MSSRRETGLSIGLLAAMAGAGIGLSHAGAGERLAAGRGKSSEAGPPSSPGQATAGGHGPRTTSTPGVLLEDLTWLEAEKRLTADTVVVIPIGAAAKEHGPHLRLKNDLVLAEYLKRQVLERAPVVIAPTVNYHYYPAFLEYPGSTSLRLETARDLLVDICRSLAEYGPRRFYALNTGVSTVKALAPAAELLAADSILFRYTDWLTALGPLEKELLTQEGGTHADEGETSMMLYMAPELVDMGKAVKDYHPKGTGGLSRTDGTGKTYSATGIWGDPTLATREKGERLTKAMIDAVLRDLETLRQAPLPVPARK